MVAKSSLWINRHDRDHCRRSRVKNRRHVKSNQGGSGRQLIQMLVLTRRKKKRSTLQAQ